MSGSGSPLKALKYSSIARIHALRASIGSSTFAMSAWRVSNSS
jgi:hypothetical protein